MSLSELLLQPYDTATMEKVAHKLHLVSCQRFSCAGTERESRSVRVTMQKPQKGFSLIELLIVVAIILIIAAIAIPNLLRSKILANESSAVGAVRTIGTAEVTYSSSWGSGFAINLTSLGGPAPCNVATAGA